VRPADVGRSDRGAAVGVGLARSRYSDEETILWRAGAGAGRARLRRRSLSWKPCSKSGERAADAQVSRRRGRAASDPQGAALRQYIDKDTKRWGKLAKALNLAPQ